jgi:hypothetical protein
MAVGDEDPSDVGDVVAGRGDTVDEVVPGTVVVPARVDQDGTGVGLEQVHKREAERVVRDQHGDHPHAARDLLDLGPVHGRASAAGAVRTASSSTAASSVPAAATWPLTPMPPAW